MLDGCTISNCHVNNSNGGGAIENQGTLYASNTTFSGNYSGEIGGAINNYGGNLYLSGCTFTNNYTTSSNANYGGAIGNNSSNTLVLVNCTFSGNKYGGSNGTASDLGVFNTPGTYTIAGCTGIAIDGATLTTYQYGTATLDYSGLSAISFTYDQSDTPIALPAVPKHLITATYDKQTRSLEQPLPYATTVGELYEAVSGQSFSDLISTMSLFNKTLTGISSTKTDVVSIGEVNGASTPVTVNADGKATIGLNFGGYVQGIFVSVTPPLYVTMKDGVKDADKWTVKVGEGQAQALPIGGLKGDGSETVTLQYNGRLKVKSVTATTDAEPVKEPATVTTAPTGAAVVGVGKTTELVSGGAANGGTMMYKVQATKTKPPTTVGFSDAVPTAQTITASGKVYVWYYVKGDDTHTDSEIAATPIVVPVADIIWDATNVSSLQLEGTGEYEKEGITLSCNADVNAMWNVDEDDPTLVGIMFETFETGGFTFTAPTGKKFTKIEMNAVYSNGWQNANLGTGWTFNADYTNDIYKVTWTGSAASTVGLLTGANNFHGEKISYIAFYLSE
ncbi:MAG: right-handed parallel beta-helix repeat-containing protein [Prevotella sp.]|nr:right-handed parallel beta-helix repeat-containing protein [Prevotella sp.]